MTGLSPEERASLKRLADSELPASDLASELLELVDGDKGGID